MAAALLHLAIFSLALFPSSTIVSAATVSFSPEDNILIDCGANSLVNLPDGRIFKADAASSGYLQANDNIQISTEAGDLPSPLCLTARILVSEATYSFRLTGAGWHWLRLHFYPMSNSKFDLKIAMFSVNTDDVVLLHRLNMNNNEMSYVVKEYLLNVAKPQLNLKFSPMTSSFAFINAIEVVSAWTI